MTLAAHGNKVSGFFCSYTDDREHHDRLKPCPFCGTNIDLEICNTHSPSFWVACRNCGVEVLGCTPQRIRGGKILTAARAERIFAEALELAIAQWNTRAQPCASQGCGGAVQEAVANVVSCWNRFRWAKETSDAVSALAALSTAPRSLDGATPGGQHG